MPWANYGSFSGGVKRASGTGVHAKYDMRKNRGDVLANRIIVSAMLPDAQRADAEWISEAAFDVRHHRSGDSSTLSADPRSSTRFGRTLTSIAVTDGHRAGCDSRSMRPCQKSERFDKTGTRAALQVDHPAKHNEHTSAPASHPERTAAHDQALRSCDE